MKRLMALAFLVGCHRPVQVVPAPVAVPCPEPPVLTWPPLPVESIQPGTPGGAVAQAYLASLYILKARLAEALALLNGYRTATPPTTIPRPGGQP